MRSGLDKHGKLLPPRKLDDAIRRRRQCGYEAARCQDQLNDASRAQRFSSQIEYVAWRDRADHALKMLRSEEHQLTDWIDAQRDALFRKAYDVLASLRDDDFDFTPGELAIIGQLDDYFQKPNATNQETKTG